MSRKEAPSYSGRTAGLQDQCPSLRWLSTDRQNTSAPFGSFDQYQSCSLKVILQDIISNSFSIITHTANICHIFRNINVLKIYICQVGRFSFAKLADFHLPGWPVRAIRTCTKHSALFCKFRTIIWALILPALDATRSVRPAVVEPVETPASLSRPAPAVQYSPLQFFRLVICHNFTFTV